MALGVDRIGPKLAGDLEGVEFNQTVGAITANSFLIFDFWEKSPFDKYAPFDALRVANDSNNTVRAYINQRADKYQVIYGKTEKIIRDIHLYTLKVEDRTGGAGVTAGDIELFAVKQGVTADTFAKDLVRKTINWWL